jgi:predicted metalloprotease with PDZ domain
MMKRTPPPPHSAAAFYLAAACLGSALAAPAMAANATTSATVEVDARAAPRGIEQVHMTLPVKPGKLTLIYPKWLPGEHAPTGPIGGVSGLKFLVNGQPLTWTRDPVEMYAFHLTIPANVRSLDIAFEVDAAMGAGSPNALRTSTEALAIVLWNQLVFYPAGTQSDDMQISAKLHLPKDWSFGTALPKTQTSGDTTQFADVTLTTLIDSPVLAGRYFKTVELGGTAPVYLHLAADSAAALNISANTTAQFRKLVQEATALFGATHYQEYHFLWSLSDQIDYEGIEHHQSSDNRSAERSLIDDDDLHSSGVGTLLPHEYVHSWNGKYRRPAGLATGNYDTPMRGELLWVYEGLTEYLGMVLSGRSGLENPADARDNWADIAAEMQYRKGREWRPLADTATAAQIGYTQLAEWKDRTRATDFYVESALLWLEADVLIRTRSGGAKSLDDFCKIFHGPPSTAPKVVAYEFDDVVKALNTVLPYDWRGFWTERVNRLRAAAPLEGLSASGWHLSYAEQPSDEQRGNDAFAKRTSLSYSLGFTLKDDGAVITGLVPGSPADVAGITPDSHLIAVNRRKFSKDVLLDALKAGGSESRGIQLLLQNDDFFDTVELRYAGHGRYPRLERDAGATDLLSAILSAKTP